MRYLESISQFSALQMIRMNIRNDYDCFRVCLRAPRLWNASLHALGKHQINLRPGITHFSGSITCLEDLHFLSKLPNLRRCQLEANLAEKEAPVVTVAHLTHLYADIHALEVLSAPLLGSLVVHLRTRRMRIGPRLNFPQETLIRFLHRSKCHLESLSVSEDLFTSDPATGISILEACSTISRLKLELTMRRGNFGIVEALTSPSVLPNLQHLILLMPPSAGDQWNAILRMARSRRDAGMLNLVEIQFSCLSTVGEQRYGARLVGGMRLQIGALTQDDFEMRIVKWLPSFEDPVSLEHLFGGPGDIFTLLM
ncbi:hypothetical protein EDD18DRAFT_205744 [Armillaria luteobubalina]|uniref:Uncharacterized protein n=1 Tax=Armillaria luteobubalina TaxID=153913 RepID=A0AA39Q527_9AGAR|nr:hypothetical protein EDD18DRAFT_205744 [Armillaria luteobubalina]